MDKLRFKTYFADFVIEPDKTAFNELADEIVNIALVQTHPYIKRDVYRIETADDVYYLKLTEILRSKWRHRILFWRKWNEWNNLIKLRKKGVDAAEPCFRGRRTIKTPTAFFTITKELVGRGVNENSVADMEALGGFFARLHSLGIYYKDNYTGNFIVSKTGRFRLFDVQEMSFLPFLPKRPRLANLGHFFAKLELRHINFDWRKKILQRYNKVSGYNLTLTHLDKAICKAKRKRIASYVRHCLRTSGQALKVKAAGMTVILKRGYENLDIENLLQGLTLSNSLKNDSVFKVQNFVVKRAKRRCLHADRPYLAYKMAAWLIGYGINVPKPVAYIKQGGYSYFVAEHLNAAVSVNEYFTSLHNQPQAKRAAIHKFAEWVNAVHHAGVFQHDFKSCNVLCANGAFYMIDLDGVRLRQPFFDDKVYNLGQLNASMSKLITLRDRLRFFKLYADLQEILPAHRREVLQRIWDIMLTKNTAYYDLMPEDIWKPQLS